MPATLNPPLQLKDVMDPLRYFARTLIPLGLAIGCSLGSGATALADEADEFWERDFKPFLQNYCFDCHSGDSAEADIDFELYKSTDGLANERPRWNQVRGMIEIGAMPPADYDVQPSREAREKIANWLDHQVNSVDCGLDLDPGRVTMRRLNNVEYDNTLRDLLGIDFSPSKLAGFPSDSVGNGFDNQGDVLTLSPIQLEKYFQASQIVTSRIIVHDPETQREHQSNMPALYRRDQRSVRFDFAAGEYEVRARLEFQQDGKEKVPVSLLVDGQEIQRWEVGKKRTTYAVDHEFTAGSHELTLHYVDDPGSDEKSYRRRVDVEFVAIEGPRDEEPLMPEPHRRLFVSRPTDDTSVSEAARQIFQPLIGQAFRREPQPIDVDRVVNLVQLAVDEGESFENAVGLGLQSVLVSPHFLFRVENAEDDAGELEQLTDYARLTGCHTLYGRVCLTTNCSIWPAMANSATHQRWRLKRGGCWQIPSRRLW
ncbi:MAG: DUF1587 domain-containing protein [Pirellulaceae bacterium]